jgi:hypothetical protein
MFIKTLLVTWWCQHPTGRAKYLQEQQLLCETTGKVLRIDHTYKIVKCLGVAQGKQWVCFVNEF